MSILTDELIDRFAASLKAKMRAAEEKYGYKDDWLNDGWAEQCRADMMAHIGKGDPRDVAIYTAFIWHHGWSTNE